MSGTIINITGRPFPRIFSRVKKCTPISLLLVACPQCQRLLSVQKVDNVTRLESVCLWLQRHSFEVQ